MKSGGLFSSSMVYGAGAVANRLAALLFLPIFTAHLSPSDYGVVGLLSTIGMLLTPVFSFGLGTSIGICYFANTASDARQQVIRSAFVLVLLSALCLILLAVLFKGEISRLVLSSPEFGTHVLVTLLGVAFGLLTIPLQLRLQFESRPGAFVASTMFGLVGSLGLSYFLVAHLGMGAIGLLMGTALGQILTLATSGFCRFDIPRFKDVSSPVASELLSHGLPMIPSFFLLFFLQNAVRWPLEWQGGLHDVGLFTIGTNFGLAMTVVTGGVVAAWLPHALSMAERWEEGRHELAQSLLCYFAAAGYLVLLFFVGAQPVLKLFVAADFFPAWTVVGLSALAQFLISLFSLVLPPLYLAKKVRLVIVPQALAAVAAGVLMFWLPQMGILGAALVVTLSALILLLLTLWVIQRAAMDVLPIPYNIAALMALAGIVCAGAASSFLLEIQNLPEFCAGAACILVVSALLILRIAKFPLRFPVRKTS